VIATDPSLAAEADLVADTLALARHVQPQPGTELYLIISPDGPGLQLTAPASGVVRVDFTQGRLAHRRRFGGGESLARACAINPSAQTRVIDATGGLARDAFILASVGARVTLIEQSPVLCHLIQAAIEHALCKPETADIAARMRLHQADARAALQALSAAEQPDTVYLDPMYPVRQKSARVKKDMQVLHQLIGPDMDGVGLLQSALLAARKRVVVKRPAKAEPLAKTRLIGAVRSGSTRFDLYAPYALDATHTSAEYP
jgi:16S rRNA (guanine1516-N2)-methyltransferase